MGRLNLAVGHSTLATADPAKLARGGEACTCPLDDQSAFHLSKAGHDVEEEAAGGCLGVDTVRQAEEVQVARLKGVHEIHEPLDAPPQSATALFPIPRLCERAATSK